MFSYACLEESVYRNQNFQEIWCLNYQLVLMRPILETIDHLLQIFIETLSNQYGLHKRFDDLLEFSARV